MNANAETEDELQNVNMVESDALRAAEERKRKATAHYTGYDDEEFDEGRIGKKADVLGKYDDEFSTGKVKSEVSFISLQGGQADEGLRGSVWAGQWRRR